MIKELKNKYYDYRIRRLEDQAMTWARDDGFRSDFKPDLIEEGLAVRPSLREKLYKFRTKRFENRNTTNVEWNFEEPTGGLNTKSLEASEAIDDKEHLVHVVPTYYHYDEKGEVIEESGVYINGK